MGLARHDDACLPAALDLRHAADQRTGRAILAYLVEWRARVVRCGGSGRWAWGAILPPELPPDAEDDAARGGRLVGAGGWKRAEMPYWPDGADEAIRSKAHFKTAAFDRSATHPTAEAS